MVPPATQTTPSAPENSRPLVCDLDETLIRGDSFRSALRFLLTRRPGALLRSLPALFGGWAAFKTRAAALVRLADLRPDFNPLVLAFLRREAAAGRLLALCTATPQPWADEAARLAGGLFKLVIGSDRTANLKGKRKAARLVELFGRRGFDYIGDSLADLAVWREAATPVFAGRRQTVKAALKKARPDFVDLTAQGGYNGPGGPHPEA